MWRRRGLALGVGAVLAVLALETGVRVAGLEPPRTSTRKQRESVRERLARENAEERNSLGFHDVEWSREKPPGTWRVLFLGDSFTENSRVPLAETFVKRVEASLNRTAPPGRRYELWSVARGGWGTTRQHAQLVEMLDYDPDAVVVVYFINDATSIGSNQTLARELNEATMERDGWLNRVSAAWDWIDYHRRRREVTETVFRDYHDSFRGTPKARKRWRESKEALRKIAGLTRERGIPAGLLVFPVLVQLREDHELVPLYDLVLDHARLEGMPAESLLPAFYGCEPDSLWVSRNNSHPNSEANRRAAPLVEAFLRDAGLLPGP